MNDVDTAESIFGLESILKKVQRLLAKADDPSLDPAEAALFRDKAEAMMIKYRIDAAEAAERGEDSASMKPAWTTVWLGKSGQWMNYLSAFASMAARHCGVRVRMSWDGEQGGYVGITCGFEHDVKFFELIFTSIMEGFSSRLDPRFDPKESLQANALRLRQGGMERARIARLLFAPASSVNEQKGQNRRVTKMIKDEAQRLGKPNLAEEVLGRSFNAKTYRDSYARGFYDEMWHRLWTVRQANADTGLVLRSAKERVDEAWYERYPMERPTPVDPNADPYAALKGCDKCKKAKSGACRDHRMRSYRGPNLNAAAVSKGRSAARSVDVGHVTGRKLGG